MRDTKTVRGILLFAGLWALAALGLRIVTITGIMDEYGLIPMRSPILPATVLFCLLGGAILLILCLRLNRLPGTEGCFAGPVGWQAGELLAAAGLLLGSVLRLAHAGEMEYARRVLEYFGPVAAVLMAATSLLRNRMDKLVFWLRLLCAIWFCAGMILRFRSWSQDPLIIHLTPTLLSFLCSLLSLMLLSGFPLGAGHRRSTVLFGLCSGVFTLMLLPDYLLELYSDPAELLTLLSVSLWSLLHALRLLRPSVQAETGAAPQ